LEHLAKLGEIASSIRLIPGTLSKIEAELKESGLKNVSTSLQSLPNMVTILRDIESQLEKLEKTISKSQMLQKSAEEDKESGESMDPSLKEICDLYNTVVEDPDMQKEFIQDQGVVWIGVTNAMRLRQDPNTEPIFEGATNGDFLAVHIVESTRYAVMQRFNITLQKSNYGPGAMNQVFDCPNYDGRFHYCNVEVIKPAIFEPDPHNAQRWILKEKGKLDIGQGTR